MRQEGGSGEMRDQRRGRRDVKSPTSYQRQQRNSSSQHRMLRENNRVYQLCETTLQRARREEIQMQIYIYIYERGRERDKERGRIKAIKIPNICLYPSPNAIARTCKSSPPTQMSGSCSRNCSSFGERKGMKSTDCHTSLSAIVIVSTADSKIPLVAFLTTSWSLSSSLFLSPSLSLPLSLCHCHCHCHCHCRFRY